MCKPLVDLIMVYETLLALWKLTVLINLYITETKSWNTTQN